MDIQFQPTNGFTPNHGDWTPVGRIEKALQAGQPGGAGDVFTLVLQGGARTLQLSVLSPTCFRLRFNPAVGATYGAVGSPAVVQHALGPVHLNVVENSAQRLLLDTGRMRIEIGFQPYRLRVFRGAQLISADEPSYNLVYIPGQRVIANFKTRAPDARYSGFGEKPGSQVLKNQFTMTQFNYDNYIYNSAPAPKDANPLNPSGPLYISIPFMMEVSPHPAGDFAGAPYAYGLFLDNVSQSYFNMGSNDYSDMDGKFYFGALFGELDTYFMLGDGAGDVLAQYTTLTGRAPMPPKYVLGLHQGAYGYYDRAHLEAVADAYRTARIPCDGLHIDVDFQDNYRTFTHSELKFPNAVQMFQGLHAHGFKCSTNVTPLLTSNTKDETGYDAPYAQRKAFLDMTVCGLVYDTRAGEGPNPYLFGGGVNYGYNHNYFNPYPYPGLPTTPDGIPLTADGNYPDLGRADVREEWGRQYQHLVQDLGMDMIWQDMMCPALNADKFVNRTFPLDLMMNDGVGYVPNGVTHNAYALFIAMGTWEGLAKLRPDTRNFIVARGGYAGIQRYAAVWTGDSASSWDFLRINVPEVLNLGLSGVPLSGCDIGGFAAGSGSVGQVVYNRGEVLGNITYYELLTRWMHVGAFLPWYRNHYDGYNKQFQEPYRYGEPVPTNCRKYVELRYRMLQIWYDALYEWTQTGVPPARALFLNDASDPAVYDHLDDQFFVGHDFLVAPILFGGQGSPPVATRSIYLPAGSDWYAFMDGAAALDPPVTGGTTIPDYRAGLDLVPIYVRSGAILPMRSKVEQYVGELAENPLAIDLYPGPESAYLMYQDDGITTAAEKNGAYRTTRITQRRVGPGREARLQRLVDAFTPPEPFVMLRFLASGPPAAVTVAGAAVSNAGSAAALEAAAGDAYYYDGRLQTTVVKTMDTRPDVVVSVG